MGMIDAQSGKKIKNVACGGSMATAAGTGDATAVTGASIDTRGYSSCRLTIGYLTTLTDTKTLAYAVAYQESSDNSNWDTAVTIQASTVAKTGSSTTAFVGQLDFYVDFGGQANGTPSATQTGGKRYVRFNFTPDMNHTSADTAVSFAVASLGGAKVLPAA